MNLFCYITDGTSEKTHFHLIKQNMFNENFHKIKKFFMLNLPVKITFIDNNHRNGKQKL